MNDGVTTGRVSLLLLLVAVGLFTAAPAQAQNLTVYDDALQNGFLDYSYGGGTDFASTAQMHSGTKSISFVGDNFNAASVARPLQPMNVAQYPVIHFWVHGGASGGQHLRIYVALTTNGAGDKNWVLDPYISGGSIAAGVWREVTVNITQPPLSYAAATYDRIDLQSDQMLAQPVLYIDDITLTQAAAPPPANAMQIEHD